MVLKIEKAPSGASLYVEKIGLTSTSFGINLSPDKCNNIKSPASLVQLRRAEVEKIGLTSTSFGINLSPDGFKNRKSPKRGFFNCGEDRAYLNFVRHKPLARWF
jgi:hypothetical protein